MVPWSHINLFSHYIDCKQSNPCLKYNHICFRAHSKVVINMPTDLDKSLVQWLWQYTSWSRSNKTSINNYEMNFKKHFEMHDKIIHVLNSCIRVPFTKSIQYKIWVLLTPGVLSPGKNYLFWFSLIHCHLLNIDNIDLTWKLILLHCRIYSSFLQYPGIIYPVDVSVSG